MKKPTKNTKAFYQGYAVACANIMLLHGNDVIARNVMTECFDTMKDFEDYGIDSADLEQIVPLMKEHLRLMEVKKQRNNTL